MTLESRSRRIRVFLLCTMGVIGRLHKSYPDLRNAAPQCLAPCIGPNAGLGCAKRGIQPALLETPEMSVPSYAGLLGPSPCFLSPSLTTTPELTPRPMAAELTPRPTAADARGGAGPTPAGGALGSTDAGCRAGSTDAGSRAGSRDAGRWIPPPRAEAEEVAVRSLHSGRRQRR
jgi:hypothetical protein